jgi:hypothetical protein
MASSCWWPGRRCGALEEGQQEGSEAVGELGGDAWRLGEAGGDLVWRGTMACSGAAARQRKKKGGGGRPGLNCEL